MVKQYFKQAFMQFRQNRFYSILIIISTSVSIAFAMVAYMAYSLGSDDLPPEVHRSNSFYSDDAWSYRTANQSNMNSGMCMKTAKAIADSLTSAQLVSFHTRNYPRTCQSMGGEGDRKRRRVRMVDREWWSLFQYDFLFGRPFLKEEYDAGSKVAVITERTAREVFHTDNAVGRTLLVNFIPYTICGVVRDVSSQFSIAYCEVWINLSSTTEYEAMYGSEYVAGEIRFIVVAKDGKSEELGQEIEQRIDKFNQTLRETTFEANMRTHTDYTFYSLFEMSPMVMYFLLACIFLIIPAMSISGLVYSILSKRFSEIGIRKAYGASARSVIWQFLNENFLLTLVGGLLGVLLSFGALYLFRGWLLGVSFAYSSDLQMEWWMFFRPVVFAIAFSLCLLFNLFSALFPVWYVSGKNIVEALKD